MNGEPSMIGFEKSQRHIFFFSLRYYLGIMPRLSQSYIPIQLIPQSNSAINMGKEKKKKEFQQSMCHAPRWGLGSCKVLF